MGRETGYTPDEISKMEESRIDNKEDARFVADEMNPEKSFSSGLAQVYGEDLQKRGRSALHGDIEKTIRYQDQLGELVGALTEEGIKRAKKHSLQELRDKFVENREKRGAGEVTDLEAYDREQFILAKAITYKEEKEKKESSE